MTWFCLINANVTSNVKSILRFINIPVTSSPLLISFNIFSCFIFFSSSYFFAPHFLALILVLLLFLFVSFSSLFVLFSFIPLFFSPSSFHKESFVMSGMLILRHPVSPFETGGSRPMAITWDETFVKLITDIALLRVFISNILQRNVLKPCITESEVGDLLPGSV